MVSPAPELTAATTSTENGAQAVAVQPASCGSVKTLPPAVAACVFSALGDAKNAGPLRATCRAMRHAFDVCVWTGLPFQVAATSASIIAPAVEEENDGAADTVTVSKHSTGTRLACRDGSTVALSGTRFFPTRFWPLQERSLPSAVVVPRAIVASACRVPCGETTALSGLPLITEAVLRHVHEATSLHGYLASCARLRHVRVVVDPPMVDERLSRVETSRRRIGVVMAGFRSGHAGQFLNACDRLESFAFASRSEAEDVNGVGNGQAAAAFTQLQSLGSYCLYDCYALRTLDLSGFGAVERIGSSFLAGTRRLRDPDLRGLERVVSMDFGLLSASEVERVDLSPLRCLRAVPSYALYNCAQLQEVRLAGLAALEEVGSFAFGTLPKLAAFELRGLPLLERIGDEVLHHCQALTAVTIADLPSLRDVGRYFAADCPSLTDVAFDDCSALEMVGEGLLCDSEAVESLTASPPGALLLLSARRQ